MKPSCDLKKRLTVLEQQLDQLARRYEHDQAQAAAKEKAATHELQMLADKLQADVRASALWHEEMRSISLQHVKKEYVAPMPRDQQRLGWLFGQSMAHSVDSISDATVPALDDR